MVIFGLQGEIIRHVFFFFCSFAWLLLFSKDSFIFTYYYSFINLFRTVVNPQFFVFSSHAMCGWGSQIVSHSKNDRVGRSVRLSMNQAMFLIVFLTFSGSYHYSFIQSANVTKIFRFDFTNSKAIYETVGFHVVRGHLDA